MMPASVTEAIVTSSTWDDIRLRRPVGSKAPRIACIHMFS
jgi:hypothetical protein